MWFSTLLVMLLKSLTLILTRPLELEIADVLRSSVNEILLVDSMPVASKLLSRYSLNSVAVKLTLTLPEKSES